MYVFLKGKFSITKAACNLLIATEVSEYQMTSILTFLDSSQVIHYFKA